jgi:SAM-dependent methyltransferase
VATAQPPQASYNRAYFTTEASGGYDFEAPIARAIDAARFSAELQRLEAQGLFGTVLDIGCATGSFLLQAQSRGWRVAGVEPSAFARRQATRRLATDVTESLSDLPNDVTFDVVTLHHVLEHLHDPVAFLASEVAPRVGRRLLIEVPNFGSLASRVHGYRWRDLRTDQHVYHYQPATLARTVMAAGLRVRSIYTLWEPLWSLRTAWDMLGLVAASMKPAPEWDPAEFAEHPRGVSGSTAYTAPRGFKRMATEVSRYALWPIARLLEGAGLGCRLVCEAEPARRFRSDERGAHPRPHAAD